jgi:prophage maintenance system killer protein
VGYVPSIAKYPSGDEAEELMLNAASGRLDVPQLAAWLKAHRPAS